ncbi:TlyA family RNA methyltransferase [uncultured Rothia sp.]|uniref:TlyA family RNA methyltransferase n=1 Tax=uncultured Rothia sp. TaxID=316088 RepID=UPI003217345D
MAQRLDKALVERELVRSRTLAAKLIIEGCVRVNGQTAQKVSHSVETADVLDILPSDLTRFVSRAGHKLEGALRAFPAISVAGKRCLDAGASTGGFTQVLLEAGAANVAAVDVGHNQLAPQLRHDSRVTVFEGMNVRHLKPEEIGGQVEITVSDLSFISLTLVMQALAQATENGGDLLLMVKPQFEVGQHFIGAGGVVKDPAAHHLALEKVKTSAQEHGLVIRGQEPSPLPGQDGNREFFLWCSKKK